MCYLRTERYRPPQQQDIHIHNTIANSCRVQQVMILNIYVLVYSSDKIKCGICLTVYLAAAVEVQAPWLVLSDLSTHLRASVGLGINCSASTDTSSENPTLIFRVYTASSVPYSSLHCYCRCGLCRLVFQPLSDPALFVAFKRCSTDRKYVISFSVYSQRTIQLSDSS